MTSKKTPSKPARPERRKSPGRRADDAPDFHDLVENSVQGILVHRNFKPLYANRSFASLFGYAAVSDILDLPLIRPLVPPESWEQVEREYDELTHSTKKSTVTRARGIRKDGSEIWMAVTQRVIDWHGKPAVQMNAFDISAQMAAEHALVGNEQNMRAILEVLPYPIYIARQADGQIVFVNRKTCLLMQKSANQLLRGQATSFFVDEEEEKNLKKILGELHDVRDIEMRMKTGQGREFTAEIAAIALEYGRQPAVLVALNDISQRKQLEAQLFHEASTDTLTGVSNRRYFLAQAEQELRRSRRFSRDLSLLMIDVDHFKSINDRFGHAGGDAALQNVVKVILDGLRQSDNMGRLGGEEFAVILPETAMEAAFEVANRLRKDIAGRPVIAGGGNVPHVSVACTASIGVAQLTARDGSIDDLINRADRALYRAKEAGRNRVECAN